MRTGIRTNFQPKADKKTTIPNDVYLYEPRHSHELAKKKLTQIMVSERFLLSRASVLE